MSRRIIGVLDVTVVAWTVVWILLGLTVAAEVRGLRELSGTLREVGQAVEQSGRTLEGLAGVPFIGDRLRQPSTDIIQAGQSIRVSGQASRESIGDLSFLLGLSIAVIPAIPVLAVYLPWRYGVVRERRALVRAAALAAGDPAFERYLAFRAAHRRPLWQLQHRSPRPWEDLADRSYAALADAELAAAGLRDSPPGATAEPRRIRSSRRS